MIESHLEYFLKEANLSGYKDSLIVTYNKYHNKPLIKDVNASDKYYKGVVKHKLAVLEAGMQESLINLYGYHQWEEAETQLLLHDLSKFSEEEEVYVNHDFSGENTEKQEEAFKLAWHHHKMKNKHHPEHWISIGRGGKGDALPMPEYYVVEMVADWIGAGKTYGSELNEWLPNNIGKFLFHNKTIGILTNVLSKIDISIQSKDGKISVIGHDS